MFQDKYVVSFEIRQVSSDTLVTSFGTRVQAQQELLDTSVTEDKQVSHICALEAI